MNTTSTNLVRLYRAGGSVEANIVRNRLLQAGIECRILGEMINRGVSLGSASAPKLYVDQRDLKRAQEILQLTSRPLNVPKPQLSLSAIFALQVIAAFVCVIVFVFRTPFAVAYPLFMALAFGSLTMAVLFALRKRKSDS